MNLLNHNFLREILASSVRFSLLKEHIIDSQLCETRKLLVLALH